jgi:hypothetical protein
VSDLERYLDANGLELAIGMLFGIGLVIFLVIAIAVGDRKPPDKKDGP